jgi:hypothetical protein
MPRPTTSYEDSAKGEWERYWQDECGYGERRRAFLHFRYNGGLHDLLGAAVLIAVLCYLIFRS